MQYLKVMSKKEKRNRLLQYFLSISQHQQRIQSIQNKLVTHIRFNPLILFKRLTDNNLSFTLQQLTHYLQTHLKIQQHDLIRKYYHKHFHNSPVRMSQFIASLLPFTPNVLRQANQKVDKQMQTKHSDQDIIDGYHRLLQTQLKAIFQVCLLQRQLKMSWQQLTKFIQRDIQEFSKKIDSNIQGCSILNIRKWMQLWVDIDEYKILNLMRWFGGYEEHNVRKMYNRTLIQLQCNCPHPHNRILPQSSLQETQINKLSKVKSEPRLKDPKQYLRLFVKYVQTIVKSEKRLSILRQGLRPYRKETQLILHQVTSKKHPQTSYAKLISKIQNVLQLQTQMVEHLLTQFQNSKISNSFLFSLFTTPTKGGKSTIKKEELVSEVYDILYTFCLSKATLKSIAREIRPGIESVFRQLDENNHDELDRVDLKLFVEQSGVKIKQNDLTILMNHLGDGSLITLQSLKEVISIQKSN